MGRYILRRAVGTLPTFFILTVVVFFMVHLVPGDPVSIMLGSFASKTEIEAFRAEMGLDKPLYIQYGVWLSRALRGNLGKSITSELPVLGLVIERLRVTANLALLTVLISLLMGPPLGIIAAIKQNTRYDQGAMTFSLLGLSVPDFVAGLLLVIVFAVGLNWLPSIGYEPLTQGLRPWLRHLIMPAFAAGFIQTAIIARMTRSSVIDVLRQDYVVTARSKGLRESKVICTHVLRNALIPVVTVVGINTAGLFRSAVVIETLFSLPGIGRTLIVAIYYRDYPLIQGCVLAIVLIYIVVNFLVDLTYAWLDPRIHYT